MVVVTHRCNVNSRGPLSVPVPVPGVAAAAAAAEDDEAFASIALSYTRVYFSSRTLILLPTSRFLSRTVPARHRYRPIQPLIALLGPKDRKRRIRKPPALQRAKRTTHLRVLLHLLLFLFLVAFVSLLFLPLFHLFLVLTDDGFLFSRELLSPLPLRFSLFVDDGCGEAPVEQV